MVGKGVEGTVTNNKHWLLPLKCFLMTLFRFIVIIGSASLMLLFIFVGIASGDYLYGLHKIDANWKIAKYNEPDFSVVWVRNAPMLDSTFPTEFTVSGGYLYGLHKIDANWKIAKYNEPDFSMVWVRNAPMLDSTFLTEFAVSGGYLYGLHKIDANWKIAKYNEPDFSMVWVRNTPMLDSTFLTEFAVSSDAAAAFIVDNLGDMDDGNPYTPGDGTNTLRKCIRLANGNAGPDTINFGLSGTISPTSALPEIIDDGTVIDASSQWIGAWPSGQPGITLDGGGAGDALGLVINGADNCYIRGLFIKNFNFSGIQIRVGGQYNTIGGTGEGYRNILSGNGQNGVAIVDPETNNNRVIGNYIGTDVNGTAAIGNSHSGVSINFGAWLNIIGGTAAGERNIISGNAHNGVIIGTVGANNNRVIGNYIGTDVNGTAALGDSGGVAIVNGAQSNIIGGTTESERNIISGKHCVVIRGSGTNNNVFSGNYIGTDVTGTVALGNSGHGVEIDEGAQSNTIGGTTIGERNIISGNNGYGVVIKDEGTNNNKVSGNYIGVDVTGTNALGNSGRGISIFAGAQSNIIGGTTESERNIISGNGNRGVEISGTFTDNNVVSGNYIGTDVSGTLDLGNSDFGIHIGEGAKSNTIGGATVGEKNLISGNDSGVSIRGEGTNNNKVCGNYIGTDVSGTLALANSVFGIRIIEGAKSNIIGGTTKGEKNIISGNANSGVVIGDLGTNNNMVCGNYIGTDVTGTATLGNLQNGVSIHGGAQSNTIGGATEGERNIISGNGQVGVAINNSGTNNNTVSGNYIGTDVTGTLDLGNSADGIVINGGASNTIGGAIEGERNIISGNDEDGINIINSGTNNNVVCGNYIGTDVNGIAVLGNLWRGIRIDWGAQSNIIGGSTEGERNIISGNEERGVSIGGQSTDNNIISGNYIGTDVNGTNTLGSQDTGVLIENEAKFNTIGGTTTGERNIISGNKIGVAISNSDNNVVSGNYIGTDVTGTADTGNSGDGVHIVHGANSNIIGGTTAGERNIIAGNGGAGVYISGEGTDNNKIIGNYIGADVTGTVVSEQTNITPTIALGNGICGVLITQGAKLNIIGGTNEGERNIITGNDKAVVIGDSEAEGNVVSWNYIGPEPPTTKTGDVSGDNTISAYDAALILQYVVGLIDDFPADSMVSPSTISPRSYIVGISELSAREGDKIHVPIAINDATGLWAGGISLKYDQTVLRVLDVLPTTKLNGSYWKANTELDGEIRFAFATTEPTNGQGNILMVEFEVLPNTEGKTSPLIIENVNLSNSLNIIKNNGSLTVIPSTFALLQNYPNPFNPDTWIPFKIATDASVTINIYNQKGQLIRTIALGPKAAGVYFSKDKAAYWDGRDDFGEKVSSGVYFYTLQAGEFIATRKLAVVK